MNDKAWKKWLRSINLRDNLRGLKMPNPTRKSKLWRDRLAALEVQRLPKPAMTVVEAGRRVGKMTVAEAGRKGGRKVRDERGHAFFVAIGKKGGAKVRELIEAGRKALKK